MPDRPTQVSLEPNVQKKLAADLFNYTWTLLEKRDRTELETSLMINAAHASRFFWNGVGGPEHQARGEWQISRVYAAAGLPEPALRHARHSLEICQQNQIGDFDLAYAYEALARATALAGERDASLHWEAESRAAAEHLAERDDLDLLLEDLATLPR